MSLALSTYWRKRRQRESALSSSRSTTSVFGRALVPQIGEPAAWITEEVVPLPRNIYGVTKIAAENLCELFHNIGGLRCLILERHDSFRKQATLGRFDNPMKTAMPR